MAPRTRRHETRFDAERHRARFAGPGVLFTAATGETLLINATDGILINATDLLEQN